MKSRLLMACIVCVTIGMAREARGQGACCLSDGCQPALDEIACGTLGGFYIEGGECSEDACGIGACCAGLTCVMTEAYTCFLGARDFQGAGTDCADDPCDIAVGACCTGDACSITEEDECLTGGGTWLGPGTNCVLEPCDFGACCIPEDCLDGQRYECLEVEGDFILGAECETDPCAPPDDCPPGTIYSQTKDGPDEFNGYTSEASASLLRFDDFFAVAGPVSGVFWWGFDLEFTGGSFIECDEPDPTFDVTFYEDAGGWPGAEVCSHQLTATRTPTGITYLGAELNEYKVNLPEPCVLVNGWLSIVGRGDPACWFLWLSSGRGESYCEGCMSPWETEDLSFCLLGTEGGVFGACCDDATADCLDATEISECIDPGERFAEETLCADLEPTCGIVPGACCFADATCSLETEDECGTLGGDWLGAWTLCERCPCITPCPAGGVQEGEPVCSDGYLDFFNGGCDGPVAAFSPISLCEPVCGESGVFELDSEFVGDFDWYEIEIGSTTLLTWTVEAEFEVGAWVVDGRFGCSGAEVLDARGALECSPATVTVSVGPGTYWVVAGPIAASDAASCGARYVARMTTSGECPGDCDGDGTVTLDDYPIFEACMTGPTGDLGPGCDCADMNGDRHADMDDFGAYQMRIGRPG